jgi:hypothetical protein
MTKIDYVFRGDVLNVLTLLLGASYTFSTSLFLRDSVLFDAEWKEEGFCISNSKKVKFFTSYDTSLYVDLVLFSVVLM